MSTSYPPSSTAANELVEQLSGLDWSNEQNALATTRSILATGDVPSLVIEHEFAAWKRNDGVASTELLSRETSTHWKWFVGGSLDGPLLWIHEYKPSNMRRSGYAQSIHDHRYSFCSSIVSGGYVHHIFTLQRRCDPALRAARTLVAPCIYVLDADEIHAIGEIQDGTLTLIVQAPKRRGYSTEYFTDGTEPRRHYDFASRARHCKP